MTAPTRPARRTTPHGSSQEAAPLPVVRGAKDLAAADPAIDGRSVPAVTVLATEDGMLVGLAGAFADTELSSLREALLSPRPHACRHVLVDAAGITELSERALAVLLAAAAWVRETGGYLTFTRISPAVAQAATRAGVHSLLGISPDRVPASLDGAPA